MAATRETNDRLLLFFRTAAATTELMASGMAASAEIVAPLAMMSHAAGGSNVQHHARGAGESGDSAPVSTRHAQSLAVTVGALRELHGQVAGSLRGLARVVRSRVQKLGACKALLLTPFALLFVSADLR